MITYKIIDVNWVERIAQIRYSKDGYNDYYIQTVLDQDGDFDASTEAALHAEAVERATEAVQYWNAVDNASTVTLSSDTRTLGNITLEDAPDFNVMTHYSELVKTEDGDNITYSYNVIALPDEAVGMNVRQQRDDLLHHTDHHALGDRTLSTAMAEYRQALRDITDQEGFPHNLTWPVAPIE